MERAIDDLTLAQLRLLVWTADGGSFTAAATRAGMSPAAVSMIVTRVEKRLGAPLFVRATRQMRLTETGENYITQCRRQALDLLDDATTAAAGGQTTLTGQIRISVPAAYAYWRLFSRLVRFREGYRL